MHSVFSVKQNIQSHGKAFAYYSARQHMGAIRALYLLWTALHMMRHDAKQYGITI